MREYIRHPTDIPLEYKLEDVVVHQSEYLNNVSETGLSFRSSVCIEPGSKVHIRIPLRDPVFEAVGIVMWCREGSGQFDAGVRFEDASSLFRVRMVEQICHIEHYKKEVFEKEGRELTGKEAATEWISKFAKDFPR